MPTTTSTIPTTTTTITTTTTTLPTITTTIPTPTTTIPTTTTTNPTTTSITTVVPTTSIARRRRRRCSIRFNIVIAISINIEDRNSDAFKTLELRIIVILRFLYRRVRGFILVNIISFRRGSLVVDHTIVTSDTPEATTDVTNALVDLASGGTVSYNNQSVTASGITLEADDGQEFNITAGEDRCDAFTLLSSCGQGRQCLVIDSQAVCVEPETLDGNGLVIGLAVGLPVLCTFLLFLMLFKCYRGRYEKDEPSKNDDSLAIYASNIRSRYNAGAPDWKQQPSFYLNRSWEGESSQSDAVPSFSYLDAFNQDRIIRKDIYNGFRFDMDKRKLRKLDLTETQSDV
ncbi:uncharacterized protein LOC110442423 [Mizuhopecten yessoensis]|uniref:Uncharacterized protein n=1 Tax=Mizuhopecten yessoensis TaxID=6573 RepID=A0A210PH85_MIZYE|nr:uncharacterized protein LOC110442423 [Mizuhopecten yessoensis]OWF35854.1 hypothetical protein KP79_PYT24337 [Mizuhopecten yessoensis]